MSNDNPQECLLRYGRQATSLMQSAHYHGHTGHHGMQNDFMFEVAMRVFNFYAGAKFIERSPREDFDHLNKLVGQSPWEWAALDIHPSEVMCEAILLGRALIAQAEKRREMGETNLDHEVHFPYIARNAAIDVIKIFGEAGCSPGVLALAAQTDDQIDAGVQAIDAARELSARMAGPVQGRA